MADTNVAIRLGVVGESDVNTSLQNIGDIGDKSTQRLVSGFEKASAAADAAIAKAQAAGQRVAAALAVANSSNRPASIGANQDAQVRAYNDYLADQKQKVEALLNAINPLRVAEAQYADEMRTVNGLLAQGAISQDVYEQGVARANKTLQDAKNRLSDAAEGHNKLGAAGLVADHVVRSFSDSVAAGRSPLAAFALESGRVVEGLNLWAAQSSETEGAMGKLANFMGGPWGLGVTIGLTVLTSMVGKLFETDDAAQKAADQGLKDFEQREKDLGSQIDSTTGKLNAQTLALARLTASQFPAAIQGKATETQGDTNSAFAAARAFLQSEGSTRSGPRDVGLSRAITNAGPSSSVLAENVNALVAAGRNDLAPLANTVSDFAGKAIIAAQAIKQLQGAQTEFNTAAQGGTVLTTAVVKTLVDRQLATDAVSKAQQHLTEVEDQESKINAMVGGPAKQAALKAWQADLVSARKAVEDAKSAEEDARAAEREHEQQLKASQKAAEQYAAAIAKTAGEVARFAAENDKKIGESFAAPDKEAQKGLDDEQKARLAVRDYTIQQISAQKDSATLQQAELDTVTMGADQRQIILDKIKATIEAQKDGREVSADELDAILKGVEAQDLMTQAIARSSAAMSAVRDFADSLVDDLASGKNIAQDLYQEFIKLAALNPLKNLINGNSNLPTLSSVAALLSGKTSISSNFNLANPFAGSDDSPLSIPGFAGGTNSAPGGLAWVAENGPELINLPRGASVTPAAQTRQILSGATNQPVQVQVVVTPGQMFEATVAGISDRRIAAQAPATAAGGAQLARRNAILARRQSLTGY